MHQTLRTREPAMTEPSPQAGEARRSYYDEIGRRNLAPLWESLHNLVPAEPRTSAVPAHWSYRTVRPLVLRSGEVITAEEAIRRVLVLENPGLPGRSSITSTLYAGFQLILPGEFAPSHRHSQSALRFLIEGSTAWTSVSGERTIMRPGDFVITPSWAWHDHGNAAVGEGGEPVVWLDGLDIPLVRSLDLGFAENAHAASPERARPEGNSFARFGHNMAPVRYRSDDPTSPVFSYPYERTREALERLCRHREIDAWDGVKLRYVNPMTGGWPMPTIATFMQLLPAGFAGRTYRSTDATVFCVVEGAGTATIEGIEFAYEPHDVFVAPAWTAISLKAADEAVLFSFSDRPVQTALNLFREERFDDTPGPERGQS